MLRAACAAQRCDFDPASDLAVVVRRCHDGPAVLDTLVEMSVSDPSFPGVPAALHAAAAGRPASLNALIARVHAGDAATRGELSQGLHASTLCADVPMPWGGPDTPLAARPAALARAVARLTTAQVWPFDRATAAGNGLIQTCLYWPPAPAPPAATASRASLPPVPVLLLAGGHDLSTPLADARAQAALRPMAACSSCWPRATPSRTGRLAIQRRPWSASSYTAAEPQIRTAAPDGSRGDLSQRTRPVTWCRSGVFGPAAGPRAPAGAHRSCLTGQPPGVGQRAAEQKLDLGVGAAQLVLGPSGQGVVHGRVQPQQYALALAHLLTVPALLVEGAGVDDLLGGLLLAQHGLGDLWSVGQPGQACLDDRHAGRPDPPIWAYLRLTYLIPYI